MSNLILPSSDDVFEPRAGYNIIAKYFESWHWYQFWQQNEAPIVIDWLKNLNLGLGLDAGSGTGPYIKDILALKQKCISLDISSEMLDINKKNHKGLYTKSQLRFIEGDVCNLPFEKNTFDWILCSRVLTHVQDIRIPLSEFARVLKPFGHCLISDIHAKHPYTAMGVKTNNGKINIATYKHSTKQIRTALSEINCLDLVDIAEYKMSNLLKKPSKIEFKKLYTFNDDSIFFICKLIKT